MYALRWVTKASRSTVRSIACAPGYIVLGGLVGEIAIYDTNEIITNGAQVEAVKLEEHVHEDKSAIYSCVLTEERELFFGDGVGKVTSCFIGSECVRNACGKEVHIYVTEGGAKPVSSLAVEGHRLWTGSWGGFLSCIDLETGTTLFSLSEKLAHAVCLCVTAGGNVLASSQAAHLLLVDPDGKVLYSLPNVHTDIVRVLRKVHGAEDLVLSCSNDGSVKLWRVAATEFEEVQCPNVCESLSFCFDVQGWLQDEVLTVVWCCDDGTLNMQKINLHDNTCEYKAPQVIWNHYSALWTMAVINIPGTADMNLLVGSDDGSLLWFGPESSPLMPQELMDARRAEEQALLAERAAKQAAEAVNISSLPKESQKHLHRGKKAGQSCLFVSDDGSRVNVYQWTGVEWVLLGEMSNNAPSEGIISGDKLYPGDEMFPPGKYDYVFDVEIDNRPKTRLPYNLNQNAMEVAERFCARENIPRDNVRDIINFLKANAQGSPEQPSSQPPVPVPATEPAVYTYWYFNSPVNKVAVTKLQEINSAQPSENQVKDLEVFGIIEERVTCVNFLKKTLRSSELSFLFGLPCVWQKWEPLEQIFPLIDIWKYYVLHPDVRESLRRANRGASHIQFLVSLVRDYPEKFLALVSARCLANLATVPTVRQCVLTTFSSSMNEILLSKEIDKLTYFALGKFIYNCSISAKTEYQHTAAQHQTVQNALLKGCLRLNNARKGPEPLVPAVCAILSNIEAAGMPDDVKLDLYEFIRSLPEPRPAALTAWLA